MLHIRLSHSLNPQFGAVTVRVVHSIVLLTLMNSCRAQPHVIGPSQPVVATLGDDVVLLCHLDPPTTALKLTVEWTRPDLRPRFVLVLRQNVELDNKHPAYEGRTSLFSEELKLGNISLKLSRVRTSDEGGYRCFVPELNRDAAVQLVVGAASSPVIQMITNSSSIDLQCDSTGWYPEPEVFWLDAEGNLLSAGPPETVRGPDDLYTVSSRVTVEKRHSNSFTCRVTQKKINQTRETTIQVPADVVDVVPPGSSPTSPVPAIIGAVLGILFILTVVAGCLLWKWRRNKLKNKRRSLVDRAEQPREEQTEEKEEESVTLMSGREENNVNNESQSEYLEVLAQTETQQDQLTITSELITDMGGGGAEGDNERVSLIQTERETHQQQEMMRRREQNDCVKEERQEKKKPDKEDSELPIVSISEGQREQPHNLQTDQEEKKEEETQQEKIMEEKQLRREEDETEETSETETEQKDNEQQREDSKLMKQKKIKKERSEQKQRKEEKSRRMGQRDQSKKKVKDTMELKPQEGQEQEESKLEPEDKKDKDQEGNQNDRTRLREEESENRKKEINEKSKEKESEERSREPQLERQEELQRVEERMELPTQRKNDNQEPRREVDVTEATFKTKTEQKDNEQQREANLDFKQMRKEKLQEHRREQKKQQEERRRREEQRTARSKKKEEDKTERNKQEVQQVNELQTEKQQRDEPQKNERESKEQPERSAEVVEVERSAEVVKVERSAKVVKVERSAEVVKVERSAEVVKVERSAEVVEVEGSAEVVEVESKGGQEERTDGGADRDETQKTCEETEKQRQKRSEVKEETGEQQTVGKRRFEGEETIQTEEDVKTTNQDVHMESDEDESEPSKEIEKHRPLQSEVKEQTGEQLQESSKYLTLRGAESLDVVMEVEIDRNPVIHVTYGNVKRRTWKWKEKEVLHVRQRYSTQLGQRRTQRRQNKTIIWSMKKKHKKNEAIYELCLLVPPSFHQHTVQTEEAVKMTKQDMQMDSDEDESDENRVCEPLSFYQHTAQTEEDRKMTNQDIHRDSDEEAPAPHSEQEVISESERLDYDSDLDRSSVCRETKKRNILSCTAF